MCVANPAMSTGAALSLTLFMNQHSIKTASRQKIILSGTRWYKFDMQRSCATLVFCLYDTPSRSEQTTKKAKWKKKICFSRLKLSVKSIFFFFICCSLILEVL